jgi:hypothetical protein
LEYVFDQAFLGLAKDLSSKTRQKKGQNVNPKKLSPQKIFLDFCFPVNLNFLIKKNYEQKN